MCEALVRVVDQTSDDPYRDVKLTKAGMVICLFEDGWKWSVEERINPNWRIVSIPGLAVSEVQHLVHSELQARKLTDAADPLADSTTNPMLQIRAYKIDLTTMSASARAAIAAKRTGQGVIIVPKKSVVDAIKKLGAKRDPAIVG